VLDRDQRSKHITNTSILLASANPQIGEPEGKAQNHRPRQQDICAISGMMSDRNPSAKNAFEVKLWSACEISMLLCLHQLLQASSQPKMCIKNAFSLSEAAGSILIPYN